MIGTQADDGARRTKPKASRFYGVSPQGKSFLARVRRSKRLGYDGEQAGVGTFATEDAAARAVDEYIYDECPKMASKANFPR